MKSAALSPRQFARFLLGNTLNDSGTKPGLVSPSKEVLAEMQVSPEETSYIDGYSIGTWLAETALTCPQGKTVVRRVEGLLIHSPNQLTVGVLHGVCDKGALDLPLVQIDTKVGKVTASLTVSMGFVKSDEEPRIH